MSLDKKLETAVDEVLETNTFSGARKLMQDRSGVRVVAFVSFVESALPVPLLTDPFLVAAVLADKKNTTRLIVTTTISSVLGGMTAYLVASFFFENLLQLLSPELIAQLNNMISSNEASTVALTLVGAITPVPYTIVVWAVGVLKGSLLVFIIASILGRGFRYWVVGYSAYRFGPMAVSYIRKYLGIISILVIVLAVIFFWLKM